MKNSIGIFVFIFFGLLFSSWMNLDALAQSVNFKWQHPQPQGNTLNDICLVTDSMWVAVGEIGTIIRTTDRGQTWTVTTSRDLGTWATLRSVSFVSKTEGWVGGDSATLFHTSDGGVSWHRLTPAIEGYDMSEFSIDNIRFLNPSYGFACGTSSSGFVWNTTDGGMTWAMVEDFDWPHRQIAYLKDSVVMILGSGGEIEMSIDSGNTWLWDGRQVPFKQCIEINVLSPDTIWAVGDMTIQHSTDGGFTWEEKYPSDIELASITFIDDMHGWAATNDVGQVITTSDGGTTWNQDTIRWQNSWTTMYRIRMRPGEAGMLVGNYGLIATTTDSGKSWAYLPDGDNGAWIPSIQFISPVEGWAAGGYIRHTTDGGTTWTHSSTNYRPHAISFSSSANGWIAGDLGVWRTTDGGTSWVQRSAIYALCIEAIDSQNVWFGGYNNLYHTTDGGDHWTTILYHGVPAIQFLNPDTGWVANNDWFSSGADSSVFRTTDGGQTWQSSPVGFLKALRFISTTTGWVGGEYGKIWKTTDGGKTFSLKYGPIAGGWYIQGIYFSSPSLGWAVGSIGNGLGDLILRTTDAGETWTEIPSVGNNGLLSVYFTNDSTGWMGGLDGEMLKVTSSQPPPTLIQTTEAAGWNMVSVPLAITDRRTNVLFPGATGPAYYYSENYIVAETLEQGTGYWLRFASPGSGSFLGFPCPTQTIPVEVGWNMIGSLSVPVLVSNIVTVPPGMMASNAFGYTSGYLRADTLYPGKGYWIKVNGSGSLTLTSSSSTVAGRIIIVPTSEKPPSPPAAKDEHAASNVPKEFALGQNFPNPFNPSTRINYQLPTASKVSLRVFNTLGQVIATLVDKGEDAGYRFVDWNVTNFSSGVYFYRMEAASLTDPGRAFTQTRTMVLIK
jgi:photosystem II stability/assembly factor-like uncharacterized protein